MQQKPRKAITKFIELLQLQEHLLDKINNSNNPEEIIIWQSDLEQTRSQINLKMKKNAKRETL